ncbi:MAG: hypothetical protein ACREPM_25330, partial [Gemmatimonadaceae bacterium]
MKRILSALLISVACACGASDNSTSTEGHLLISLASSEVIASRGNKISVEVQITRIGTEVSPITVTV